MGSSKILLICEEEELQGMEGEERIKDGKDWLLTKWSFKIC